MQKIRGFSLLEMVISISMISTILLSLIRLFVLSEQKVIDTARNTTALTSLVYLDNILFQQTTNSGFNNSFENRLNSINTKHDKLTFNSTNINNQKDCLDSKPPFGNFSNTFYIRNKSQSPWNSYDFMCKTIRNSYPIAHEINIFKYIVYHNLGFSSVVSNKEKLNFIRIINISYLENEQQTENLEIFDNNYLIPKVKGNLFYNLKTYSFYNETKLKPK